MTTESRTVLIVEDDPASVLMEGKKLENAGLKVEIAKCGKDALKSIEKGKIDLILLDHRLPDMISSEHIKALGEHIHTLPVVIVTAHGNEQLAVDMFRLGVADYVIKDAKLNFLNTLPGIILNHIERFKTATKNRILRDQLWKSEEKFCTLVDSSQDGIIAYNKRFQYTLWNPAMERISGIRSNDILGRTPFEVFPFIEDVGEGDAFRKAVEGKTTVQSARTYDFLQTGKSGYFESSHFPLFDAQKQIIGGMAVIRDVTMQKSAEIIILENEGRLMRQNNALRKLVLGKTQKIEDIKMSIMELTENAAKTLEIERASVWFYNSDYSCIICKDLYEKTLNLHSEGMELRAAQYPKYFKALSNEIIIATDNAYTDPRTQEFSESYLKPNDIMSMLDTPIRVGNKMVGVLCCEQVCTMRQWMLDEQNFVSSLADIVSLILETFTRREMEAQLRKAKDELEIRVRERTAEISKLSHAVEQSSSMVVITDAKGNIEYVNPKFTQVTGYTPEEAIGKNPRILKSGKQNPEVYKRLWDTITSGYEWRGEFHNKKKNGELYWELASISSIRNEEGTITHFTAVKEDITERKKAESKLKAAMEEAKRANEAKSVFLSSMSHELRTPMNSILGFAQLLESDPNEPLSESQNENVEQILRSGNHLLKIINEVLDLSRIESGKFQISMEDIEAASAVAEAVTTIEPMAKKRNIKIYNRMKNDGLYIRADRTRLKQAIMNLLSNAVKYNNSKDGMVTISYEILKDDKIRINIEDNGPGVAKEKFESLFEPFNRLGMETMDVEGTGIGLTITKKLVELMGGSIGVESPVLRSITTKDEDVGNGTKFYVDFKKGNANVLETYKTEDMTDGKHLHTTTEKNTLLYVEDNPASLKLVKNILKHRPNISLFTAPHAELGIELARTQHPDLILMDINLPGMDGYKALRLLKSYGDTKGIPVIAISANAMPKDIKKGMDAGFKDYVTKPININKFLEVLDNTLTTP